MSRKRHATATRRNPFQRTSLDAHYLGYFTCFNQRRFFEAHDVLEALWLPQRSGPRGDFYKGLIQLAGAFVHLQKQRLRPAAALLRLARANLRRYPRVYEQFDVAAGLSLIRNWLRNLEATDYTVNPLTSDRGPSLRLLGLARANRATAADDASSPKPE